MAANLWFYVNETYRLLTRLRKILNCKTCGIPSETIARLKAIVNVHVYIFHRTITLECIEIRITNFLNQSVRQRVFSILFFCIMKCFYKIQIIVHVNKSDSASAVKLRALKGF